MGVEIVCDSAETQPSRSLGTQPLLDTLGGIHKALGAAPLPSGMTKYLPAALSACSRAMLVCAMAVIPKAALALGSAARLEDA